MKTTTSILLAGAVALGFTLTTATAADTLLSPRAKANQANVTTTPDIGLNLVAGNVYGAAAKVDAARVKVVPGSDRDINLVSGEFAGPAAKNPYARPQNFEIAPLVNTAKTCDASCCMKK